MMYNNDTELLFPSRVIVALEGLRDKEWDQLVHHVMDLPEDSEEHLAFVLLMTRINGCNTCNSDSFRAMRGCTECSVLNVRRYRNSDKQIQAQYEKSRKDIVKILEKKATTTNK